MKASASVQLENEIACLPIFDQSHQLILSSTLAINPVVRFCNLDFIKKNSNSNLGVTIKMASHLLLFRV